MRAAGRRSSALAHRAGWVGYLNGGTLFVKRFTRQWGKAYPDRGVNYETFTNQDMLEMESLGPLVRLAPREAVEHAEQWDLLAGLGEFKDESQFDALRAKVEAD